MTRPALLLLLLAACTTQQTKAPDDTGATGDDTGSDTDTDSGADTDTDPDTDTDTDTDTDSAAEELPDLSQDLDTGAWEDVPGYEDLPGATTYFLGLYLKDGDIWVGSETWLLYATSEWEAAGGADCQVVWTVSATETSPESCGGCELGLDVSATIDASLTTCPEALYEDNESWSVGYDVDLADDGTATVYFASSGNALASGVSVEDGAGFTFVTDADCAWF